MTHTSKDIKALSTALRKARASLLHHSRMMALRCNQVNEISMRMAIIEYGNPGDQVMVSLHGTTRHATIVRFEPTPFSPVPICVISYQLAGKAFEDHLSSGNLIIDRFPL